MGAFNLMSSLETTCQTYFGVVWYDLCIGIKIRVFPSPIPHQRVFFTLPVNDEVWSECWAILVDAALCKCKNSR